MGRILEKKEGRGGTIRKPVGGGCQKKKTPDLLLRRGVGGVFQERKQLTTSEQQKTALRGDGF